MTRRRTWGSTAAVLAAALLAPTSALGHGESDPAVRPAVEGVSPAVEGLTVKPVGGPAARLQLTNRSGSTVELLAASGEPWLRVGPGGVEANVRSPTWFASGNPDGIYRAPDGTRAGAEPRWRRVIDEPRWTWFAHELHPDGAALTASADVVRERRRARIGEWRIRTRVDGRDGAIEGVLDYKPARGGVSVRLTSPSPVAPGLDAAALNAQAPGLFLLQRGDEDVEVDGPDGRPWARLRDGRAEVDVASPTYRAQPNPPAGPPSGAADRPRWRPVPGAGASLSWIEPRTFPERSEPPERVVARDRPVVLRRWSVGVRVGGRPVELEGETVWTPLPSAASADSGSSPGEGGGAAGWLVGGGAALVALCLGAVALRRRQRVPV